MVCPFGSRGLTTRPEAGAGWRMVVVANSRVSPPRRFGNLGGGTAPRQRMRWPWAANGPWLWLGRRRGGIGWRVPGQLPAVPGVAEAISERAGRRTFMAPGRRIGYDEQDLGPVLQGGHRERRRGGARREGHSRYLTNCKWNNTPGAKCSSVRSAPPVLHTQNAPFWLFTHRRQRKLLTKVNHAAAAGTRQDTQACETLNAVDRISNTRIMMSGEVPAVRWHGNP